jgi:hypothetical protein
MSRVQDSSEPATRAPGGETIDRTPGVTVSPVCEVDTAKAFYGSRGWWLKADVLTEQNLRAAQITPPDSPRLMMFGRGLTYRLRLVDSHEARIARNWHGTYAAYMVRERVGEGLAW